MDINILRRQNRGLRLLCRNGRPVWPEKRKRDEQAIKGKTIGVRRALPETDRESAYFGVLDDFSKVARMV
jgi:hypothetical protein